VNRTVYYRTEQFIVE